MDRILVAFGPDALREMAEADPGRRGVLAPLIAAAAEREATEPRWRLGGTWGQREWRYGIRRRGDDGA